MAAKHSNALAAQEDKQHPVAATATGGNITSLSERMARYAGKGVSTDAADNMVPLIYILQSGSPQAKKNNPAYVDGAEAGMFWLRNSSVPLAQWLEFQPCYFYKDFVEWVPRDDGGGFVGRHNCKMVDGKEVPDHPEAKAQTDEVTRQVNWVLPNGNDLVLTRYHVGYAIRGDLVEPYILPFTSTGHTVSRGWMQQIGTKRFSQHPILKEISGANGDPIAPSCAFIYRLNLREKSNKQGDWFQVEVGQSRPTAQEELDRGMALFDAFESGAKKAEAPAQQDGGTSAASDQHLA